MSEESGKSSTGWGEDWWSVILGLLFVLGSFIAFRLQAPLDFLGKAVPVEWPTKSLGAHFQGSYSAYIFLFIIFIVLMGIAIWNMRENVLHFILSFTILFISSILILTLGSQHNLKYYGLEYPFWALIIGLIIGNIWRLPKWFQAASNRTDFYIKTSIVLLGANLPFSIIIKGGVWGFLEALFIVTFGFTTAFLVGKKLGFDPKFSAIIGAGGSVCGVSAAIAVGNSIKAEGKKIGFVVSLVVIYGLLLIFILPFLGKVFHLPQVVTGAWIGGSELADASGLAAASMVSDTAVNAFTLIKLSRDVLIGFICFILGSIAVAKWDKKDGEKVSASIIWKRFPKFVLAFLLASILATYWQSAYGTGFKDHVTANLNAVRTWLFTLTFFCIGLNTRFKEIRQLGRKPILAFTTVVLVNFVLGFILANLFFGGIIAHPLG